MKSNIVLVTLFIIVKDLYDPLESLYYHGELISKMGNTCICTMFATSRYNLCIHVNSFKNDH